MQDCKGSHAGAATQVTQIVRALDKEAVSLSPKHGVCRHGAVANVHLCQKDVHIPLISRPIKQWCHAQEELRASEHARELLQAEMVAEQRRAQEAVVRLQELQVRLNLAHSFRA